MSRVKRSRQKLLLPESAIVLAAGLGKRMAPLTDKKPKPLIKVAGKALIDYALDALSSHGISRIAVNIHHLADQIEAHLAGRGQDKIMISDEREELLDSGGGIAKALPYLGDPPFYCLNADTFWTEGAIPNLQILSRAWDGDQMDIVLLLAAKEAAVGFDGAGDFFMDRAGRLTRRGEKASAPLIYAGAAIINPQLFVDAPKGAFSLNLLFDRAISAQRLFGVRMDGLWLHVGTPEAIGSAEAAIADAVG